jgi:NitT/TauT family transport system substrate-binding protein
LAVTVLAGCSGGGATPSPSSAASPGGSEGPGASVEPFDMSIRADIYYTGAFMPFLVGVEEGIYEKHGINLTIGEGQGSATTLQLAANRSDDVAFADVATAVRLVAEEAPLLVVAGILQRSPLSVGAHPDSGVREPKDLEGKTGSYTAGSANEVLFPAFAKLAGFDDTKVQFQQVDFATRDTMLIERRVDFTFGFVTGNILTLQDNCECDLVVLPYADFGLVALSSGLSVAREFADEHPEELKRFLAATAEAYEFTAANLEQAMDDFYAFDPNSQVSRDLLERQWNESTKLFHSEATKDQAFGCFAQSDWESTVELMEEYGGATQGVVNAADIYTNEFLPGPCG